MRRTVVDDRTHFDGVSSRLAGSSRVTAVSNCSRHASCGGPGRQVLHRRGTPFTIDGSRTVKGNAPAGWSEIEKQVQVSNLRGRGPVVMSGHDANAYRQTGTAATRKGGVRPGVFAIPAQDRLGAALRWMKGGCVSRRMAA
jgi:hypothetical protein